MPLQVQSENLENQQAFSSTLPLPPMPLGSISSIAFVLSPDVANFVHRSNVVMVEVGHLSQPPKIILLPIIIKGVSQRMMPPQCLLLIRTQLRIVRLSIALK